MEARRQLLHVGVGGFALLLRYLTWPQAAMMAVAAVAFNRLVLPRLAPGVFRDVDRGRRWTSGIVLYPMAVLALILVFPTRLDLVATAWAILAVGDGMATLVGAHMGVGPLPWNRKKSVGGLGAFVLFGGAAAAGMMWWSTPTPASPWIAAAVLAGLAETAPIGLDDNITVPAIAAVVLWSTTAMRPELLVEHLTALDTATGLLLALNAGMAALGWAARTVTGAGALAGILIGALMILGAGAAGWIVLISTFLVASHTTRIGLARMTNPRRE
jgi:dolichol kinase